MRLFCLQCRGEFGELGDEVYCCPGCGSTNYPIDLDEELTIRITWHELRVLIMWAEQWASIDRGPGQEAARQSSRKAVYTIADRITAQHLAQELPLTFAGELRGIRDAFGDENVQVHGFDEGMAA